jgi:hypothetical protein
MTNVLDAKKILAEITVKLRNADIIPVATRGVTTTTISDTINSNVYTLSVPNVKNIRSILINSTALRFGSDYAVDYNSGNNCVITFNATQTGTIELMYDSGSDKIWPGYPRQDISINNFPQIGIEFINIGSEAGGWGNVNLNTYDLTITIYDFDKEQVRDYVTAIRTFLIENQNSFYYLRIVKPTLIGPIVPAEFEKFKNRVFKQNIDFNSRLNLEVNN